jgi:hypothetical protein
MGQAVIDPCDALKEALHALERDLETARKDLNESESERIRSLRKYIEAKSNGLESVNPKTGAITQRLRIEFPESATAVSGKLTEWEAETRPVSITQSHSLEKPLRRAPKRLVQHLRKAFTMLAILLKPSYMPQMAKLMRPDQVDALAPIVPGLHHAS